MAQIEVGDLIVIKDGHYLWITSIPHRWGIVLEVDGGRCKVMLLSGIVGWFHPKSINSVKKCPRQHDQDKIS
jgi:hypothetical protein